MLFGLVVPMPTSPDDVIRNLSIVLPPKGLCSPAAEVVLKTRCAPSLSPSPIAEIFATE